MSSGNTCELCQKPKATLECGACHASVCKSCAEFTDDTTFGLMPEVPAELAHTTYCGRCHDQTVAPALATYQEKVDRARNVSVYFNHQGKETRLLKRKERKIEVAGCLDEDQVLMKLAFAAAEAGFNGIIDVAVKSEKVRIGTYQTLKWSGTGVPSDVRQDRIAKNRSFWQNPN